MQIIKKILSIIHREYILSYRNFFDIFTAIIFFILGILIFIFSIGPSKVIHDQIGIGMIWSLLLLSATLNIKKIYQDDFNDGNLISFQVSGITMELIVVIKIISAWIFYQLPFILVIPFICILLNIDFEKLELLLITFLIGSPILISLSSIAGSMNLLNDKNFAIGGVFVILLSIPIIIFSVNIVNGPEDLVKPQINILIGLLLFFLAITPWISSYCIKIAIRNQ